MTNPYPRVVKKGDLKMPTITPRIKPIVAPPQIAFLPFENVSAKATKLIITSAINILISILHQKC